MGQQVDLEEARKKAREIIEVHLILRPRRQALSDMKRPMKDIRRLETLFKLDPQMSATHRWMQDDPAFARLSERQQISAHRKAINADAIEGLPRRRRPPEDAYKEAGFILLSAWLKEDPKRTVTWTITRAVNEENRPADAVDAGPGKVFAPSKAILFLETQFKDIHEAIGLGREQVYPGTKDGTRSGDQCRSQAQPDFS